MQLKLKRTRFTDNTTIGELFVNGVFCCYILEDKDRGLSQEQPLELIKEHKIKGKTCIPYGIYKVDYTFSPKYNKNMFLVCDVPGFEGIRIHVGNDADDTMGCLLPGSSVGIDAVYQSTVAYNKLFALLKKAFDEKENIEIEITK